MLIARTTRRLYIVSSKCHGGKHSIVLCISKFQNDLHYMKFLLRIDCQNAKEVLQKDVLNLVLKQIFAHWQAMLSSLLLVLNSLMERKSKFLPDFFTRESFQAKQLCLNSFIPGVTHIPN